MGYEIPQELEHKEVIIFGLSFKQLAYAFPMSLLAILIFFKTGWHPIIRTMLTALIAFLAVLFMFFNFGSHLKNYILYFKLIKAKDRSYKMKRFIGIKDIRDDLIINSEGKKVAVIKVEPMNFGIKTEGEQEAIMHTFRKFLNSIEFPMQILMNTHAIELDGYVNTLIKKVSKTVERTKNQIYNHLLKQYVIHLNKVVDKQGIMDRGFYVLVPETSNIAVQVAVCEDSLQNLDLEAERLPTDKLKAFVKDFYGNETITQVSNSPKHLRVNNVLNRVVYASGYPRVVEAGFLDKIVSSLGNFDLSMHITPYPIETMLVYLNKELQKQLADFYTAQQAGKINPVLEIRIKDTRRILEELQKGQDKLFHISLYINCKSESLEELDLLTQKVESALNSIMIVPKLPVFRMAQAYRSVAPLCIDELKEKRNITSQALSAFFPFTSPFFKVDEEGVWLGLNRNNIPIIRDIFTLSNPNGIVLAQSGGGKSFFAKLLMSRYLLNGTKVMVIDPQGEYRELVKTFGGQRVNLSRLSNTMINPLDLMGHDYAEKRLALMDLMQVMLGELTEPQKAFIDRAITQAYDRYEINEDPKTWSNEPPTLQDIQDVLESMEKKAITLEKTTIRSLINRLSIYVDGVFRFMNKQTNINFNNSFVCFDIGDLPKQAKPVVMFLVLDYVYMKMKQDLDRKLLVIDEAWSLLSRTEDAGYVFEIVKTCRKFNMGLLLINQEVEGLLNSEAGKSVLANSAYTLLLRQRPAVIENVVKTFNLSKSERFLLLSASVGEGLLIIEDDHTEIKVVASEEEAKIITTKADDLLKNQEQKKPIKKPAKSTGQLKPKMVSESEARKPVVKVTTDKAFYRHKSLSLSDVKYLTAKKYKTVIYKSAFSKKKERIVFKPARNETDTHFLMIHDIADFLSKQGVKVQTYQTLKPDVVFTIGKKKVAIEIETGKTLKHSKKQLPNKVQLLNKNYDEWFFVVTDKNHARAYKGYGKTVDKRGLANHLKKAISVRSTNKGTSLADKKNRQ